ncbi:acyltransferase [Corallococcus praedator]|uniref:Acyltransferase n=1 Tax=Corallococcus praedator TaxID=2316724 RepID=A0ABX9QCU6_9BACT|nr:MULTISPECIES: acyltransferase [Corallococcus]RKH34555.1 acyltransferase [Corallococcus sp. CA031C]RKI01003.1 acyltransferase [Corallococcus praedator]
MTPPSPHLPAAAPPAGAAPAPVAALDGLRAVAVVLVLLSHLPSRYFIGGFVGVDVFFVLSGFLITTTLMRGFQARGRREFASFYFRRILRLWPPLALCLVLAWALWDRGAGAGPVPDFTSAALAAVFNFANWRVLLEPDSMGLLSHTWSLSIEEQFYLVWPLGLWLMVSRGRDPRPILLGIIGTVWLARGVVVLSGLDFNLSRNSLTRMDALLLGCVLSLSQHGPWLQSRWLRWLTHPVTSVLALVTLVLASVFQAEGPGYYAVGIPVIAVAATALIAHGISRRPGRALRFLEWGPLTFIGRRSYGLYLYHFPIFFTLNSHRVTPTRSNFITFSLGALAATFVVTCLSFWLEEPLLRWGRAWLEGRQSARASNPVT